MMINKSKKRNFKRIRKSRKIRKKKLMIGGETISPILKSSNENSDNSDINSPENTVWKMVPSYEESMNKKINGMKNRKSSNIIIGNSKRSKVIFDTGKVPILDEMLEMNMTKFLKRVCINSNYCMAFGLEKDKIIKYFSFNTFDNVIMPVKILSDIYSLENTVWKNVPSYSLDNLKTGEVIIKLHYRKFGYNGYSILKMNTIKKLDNLFTEAYNGIKYINKYNNYFPCFIETYGYYKMKREVDVNTIEDITKEELKDNFQEIPINIIEDKDELSEIIYNSCDSLTNAISMQYIEKPIIFDNWIKSNINQPWIGVELSQILFQVYSVLSILNEITNFTHYNLNNKNIILYELPNVTRLIYKIDIKDNIIIETKYLVKIIDYSRVYTESNKEIFEEVCKYPDKCYKKENGRCGIDVGYGLMMDLNIWKKNINYINMLLPNKSHDLMFAHELKNYLFDDDGLPYKQLIWDHNPILSAITSMIDRVVYDNSKGTQSKNTVIKEDIYGYINLHKKYLYYLLSSEEKKQVSKVLLKERYGEFVNMDKDFLKIRTVTDMYYALYALLSINEWNIMNKKYIEERYGKNSVKNELYINLIGQTPMIYKKI